MNDMSWFEAFAIVNDFLRYQGDEMEVQAWDRFLESPFPHLVGQVAADGEKLAKAVDAWDGQGVEQLLFRLVQVVEQLPRLIGGEANAPANYLNYVVRLWELAALHRAGNAGIVNQVFAWVEEDARLREAIAAHRLKFINEVRVGVGRGAVPVVVMGKEVLFDGIDEGFFQPDYCDRCGCELDTGGNCWLCGVGDGS